MSCATLLVAASCSLTVTWRPTARQGGRPAPEPVASCINSTSDRCRGAVAGVCHNPDDLRRAVATGADFALLVAGPPTAATGCRSHAGAGPVRRLGGRLQTCRSSRARRHVAGPARRCLASRCAGYRRYPWTLVWFSVAAAGVAWIGFRHRCRRSRLSWAKFGRKTERVLDERDLVYLANDPTAILLRAPCAAIARMTGPWCSVHRQACC